MAVETIKQSDLRFYVLLIVVMIGGKADRNADGIVVTYH